jgi:hypothetical protein
LHKDPEGRIIPLVALAIAALSAYDTYDTYQTVTSSNQPLAAKGLAVAMWASPFGEAKAAGKGIKTLYHYTSDKGLKGILKSQKLNPSLKANNPKDAFYGDGQYLTDTKPGVLKNSQLARQFIIRPNKYKYTNYIELDVTNLNLIEGRSGVYLNPSNQPLDLSGRIKSYGKNEK